jgi:hypothetical protein
MLGRCMGDAPAMSRAVRWGDAATIDEMAERGRRIRRSLIELRQAHGLRSLDRSRLGQTTNLMVVSFERSC